MSSLSFSRPSHCFFHTAVFSASVPDKHSFTPWRSHCWLQQFSQHLFRKRNRVGCRARFQTCHISRNWAHCVVYQFVGRRWVCLPCVWHEWLGLVTFDQALTFVCLTCTVRRSESAPWRQSEVCCVLARCGSTGGTIGAPNVARNYKWREMAYSRARWSMRFSLLVTARLSTATPWTWWRSTLARPSSGWHGLQAVCSSRLTLMLRSLQSLCSSRAFSMATLHLALISYWIKTTSDVMNEWETCINNFQAW